LSVIIQTTSNSKNLAYFLYFCNLKYKVLQRHSDHTNRTKLGYKQGIVSIIVNILLFGLKFWAGILSGSLALIADAWHTLSDSISSIIVIVAVKLSSKKPDKEHPFGHGRWEQIAAIFIGFLLGIVAYDFIRESIERLGTKDSATFGTVAIVVTIISILAKEGLAQYAFYIARKTDNTSIKADAWHHRTDALSSLIILIGILLNSYFWWIDSALGIAVSILIFVTVFQIVKESINKLLGEKPSEKLKDQIKEIANNYVKYDLHAHHFHIHNYGTHKELTFHIKLDDDMQIYKAHEITDNIEKEIKLQLNITATIHIDPKSIDSFRLASTCKLLLIQIY
jgi:cation diffusion facilitator family transporter